MKTNWYEQNTYIIKKKSYTDYKFFHYKHTSVYDEAIEMFNKEKKLHPRTKFRLIQVKEHISTTTLTTVLEDNTND